MRDRRHLTDVATQCERHRRLAVTWRGRIEGWNRLGRLNNESRVAERKEGREGERFGTVESASTGI